MTNKNWKSPAFLVLISIVGSILLFSALISTVRLPILTSAGLLLWVVLLALTIAASRFSVLITTSVDDRRSRKPVADALVFLAVILYAGPPANTVGPATLLAALVGFVSIYGLSNRKEAISTTAIAIISTFVSASCYGYLVPIFADNSVLGSGQNLPVNALLIPLCVLAVLQYSLTTLATVYLVNIVNGETPVLPSQESIVWTLFCPAAGAVMMPA